MKGLYGWYRSMKVWKYESMKVWKDGMVSMGGMGGMKVWKYESIKVWKYLSM